MQNIKFAVPFLMISLMMPGMAFAQDNANLPEINEDMTQTTDVLLERKFEDWKDQYIDEDDFKIKRISIENYVKMSSNSSNINRMMAMEQVFLDNFDTEHKTTGASIQILLAHINEQRQNNAYNPTKAEQKYHEWALATHRNDVRLVDISNDTIMKIVSSHNNLANHGNIPLELRQSDELFWIETSHNATCKYIICDEPNHVHDMLQNLINFILPNVYAETSPHHSMNGNVYAWKCEGNSGGCAWYVSASGYGQLSDSVHNTGQNMHGIGTRVQVYGSDCTTGEGNHTLSGKLEIGFRQWNVNDDTYGKCAAYVKTFTVANSPRATWEFTYTLSSNAW